MKSLILAIVFVLLSCNQVANSSIPKGLVDFDDTPTLLRVYYKKYNVICYFPLKYGTEMPVLEGMSCVKLDCGSAALNK